MKSEMLVLTRSNLNAAVKRWSALDTEKKTEVMGGKPAYIAYVALCDNAKLYTDQVGLVRFMKTQVTVDVQGKRYRYSLAGARWESKPVTVRK